MKVEIFFSIIKYTSALSVLIPFVLCLIKFKTLDKILRVLFFYLILSIFSELVGYFLITKNIQNYLSRNLYTVLEFTCLASIFYLRFNSKTIRKLILLFYFVFLFLVFYILVFKEFYNKRDNILTTFESSFFIFISYFYLFRLIKDMDNSIFLNSYFIWVNNAILIYFSAAFVLFLFIEYIEKFNKESYYYVVSLHLLANITFNLMLSIGIWKIKRN
jgi:hypothetical protein